jgi:hypothetical protein
MERGLTESAILRRYLLGLPKHVRLFRNNVGVLVDRYGTHVRYGLCPGSSDLIGWTSRTITPADVGETWAIFTAVEVKSATGRLTQEQRVFLHAVEAAGGLASVHKPEAK